MKKFVCALLVSLLCLLGSSIAKDAAAQVQVYSREPGMFGKANTLICHVTKFHPPEIRIELLKDGQEMPGTVQTDLAFEQSWHYHLTKHVAFKPTQGETYSCKVTHLGKTNVYQWEPDM